MLTSHHLGVVFRGGLADDNPKPTLVDKYLAKIAQRKQTKTV